MKRNADAAGDRLARSHGRVEGPLAHRDDRRLVEIRPSRLGDVDLRDVTVDVHGDPHHDVGVATRGERRRRVLGVDVGEHLRRRDATREHLRRRRGGGAAAAFGSLAGACAEALPATVSTSEKASAATREDDGRFTAPRLPRLSRRARGQLPATSDCSHVAPRQTVPSAAWVASVLAEAHIAKCFVAVTVANCNNVASDTR